MSPCFFALRAACFRYNGLVEIAELFAEIVG